jgi:hypothetical protein
LHRLKEKYKARGAALELAIDDDPMAIVESWEVAPCPVCSKSKAMVVASHN